MPTVTETRTSALWSLLTRLRTEEWGGHPACADADPELFHPISDHQVDKIARAKSICRTCPIQASCLQFALQHGDSGIWGGTTYDERRQMRTTRNRTVAA